MLGTVHACYLCFPFFVGLTAGIYAFQAGTGPFGAIVVGFVAGGSALVLGRYAFSVARGPVVRLLVELLFVVPAARAGYDVTLALSHIGIPSEWWRESFAMLGAIAVGSTAWARVSMLSEPALRPGRCARPSPAADWGDDHGQVTLRVYRLSVGISADIRSSNMTATSRSSLTRRLSRVNLVGRLRSGVSLRARCFLSVTFLHARFSFPSPGTRGFLSEPIASWHVS
jgi:hypothetical protein